MTDLRKYTGTGVFGLAYAVMLARDCHAPGSVDRVLLDRMVLVCPRTADYLYSQFTPAAVEYERGSRDELERYVDRATARCASQVESVAGIARFCRDLGRGVSGDLDTMRIGGTEEQIIARGSDWCTDVARVGCILYQVAGLPARLVFLADTARAYSGHAIVEVYRDERWGAVDTSTAVVYTGDDGRPATTWRLMNDPSLIQANAVEGACYSTPGQFRSAAIANYFVGSHDGCDYTVTGLDAYYRSILEQSDKGWPGGLRWLHGEERR